MDYPETQETLGTRYTTKTAQYITQKAKM